MRQRRQTHTNLRKRIKRILLQASSAEKPRCAVPCLGGIHRLPHSFGICQWTRIHHWSCERRTCTSACFMTNLRTATQSTSPVLLNLARHKQTLSIKHTSRQRSVFPPRSTNSTGHYCPCRLHHRKILHCRYKVPPGETIWIWWRA